MPLDAIPDLSDTQVIVYSRWDRSPDIVEDQVTYPIVTALLGAPQGQGDPRLLRLRLLVRLRHLRGRHRPLLGAVARARVPRARSSRGCPDGVQTEIGPDATGVGWVYQYALVDRSGQPRPGAAAQPAGLVPALPAAGGARRRRGRGGRRLRQAVPGQRRSRPAARLRHAAATASSTRSARATARPAAACSSSPAPSTWCAAAATSSRVDDIEKIVVVGVDAKTGTPVLVRTSPRVALGPDMRRGVADLDGQGDTVGGIVVMRQGENALARDRAREGEARRAARRRLPAGVEIVTTYDRSELIQRAIDTLVHALGEEMLIVSLVILLFLWHVPSALMPIVTIPVAVLLALHPAVPPRPHLEHHVARRHRDLDRRAGRRRHRRGRERLQAARASGSPADGSGDFHAVRLQALTGGRPVGLLLAAGDRRRVPAGLHAGRPGGPPLQAARLLEEPRDGDRGACSRSRSIPPCACCSRAWTRSASGRAGSPGSRTAVAVGRYYPRSAIPISRVLFRVYEPVVPLGAPPPRRDPRARARC